MGLLDSLGYGNQGGYGGLLDALLYQSPLLKPQDVQQPQYDPMGNYTGITPQASNPFGPVPQISQPAPQQYAPPSPFNSGAAPLPGMAPGILQSAQPQPPQRPQAAPPVTQVNDANVGGYQMPRLGSVADYTPQATSTDLSAQSRQQSPQLGEQSGSLPPALAGRDILGRIGSPDGLIARLTGNDSRSIAQQSLSAQYKSLVPLLGEQKAMLAVMNPEAGKILLAQALEKKKYEFMKTEDGTIVANDPSSGKSSLSYGENNRSDTIAGPDGKLIQIPEGLDPSARKVFVNEVARNNAKVVGGELTEAQAKSTIYASKMEQSNKSISDTQGTSLIGKVASGVPLGNYAQSADYQKYKQASSNFITALLRQESGAAISKSEFERYDKEYMPQPGDTREVLSQKSEARRVAIEGMKKGAGPSYKSPSSQPGAVRKYNPATGTIE
jgi:hypothetical protein